MMNPKPTVRHPRRIHLFLVLDLLGALIFLLGIQPGLFGLDRSHVVGYLQVTVFLFGLGLVVLSSFAIETLMRPAGCSWTIREDIGARMAATGYVFAAVASAADLIGLGTQPLPGSPHLGILQSVGLFLGVFVVVIGLFLYHPGRNGHTAPPPSSPPAPPVHKPPA
jgi:hypothetical protein